MWIDQQISEKGLELWLEHQEALNSFKELKQFLGEFKTKRENPELLKNEC